MSEPLTLAKASKILKKHVTEPHLFNHALAVSAAMGSMAAHFGGDTAHWKAVGYLHDVDFERFPEEHCLHVRELLEPEGVDETDIRAIESHGWELCCDAVSYTHLIRPTVMQTLRLFGMSRFGFWYCPVSKESMAVSNRAWTCAISFVTPCFSHSRYCTAYT